MEIRVVWLLLMFSVSLVEATGCLPTTNLQCYKTATKDDEDFMCNWEDPNMEKNTRYTLYMWDIEKEKNVFSETTNNTNYYIILEKLGTIFREREIWVQKEVDNVACNSIKNKVILQCLVKYSEPHITSTSRSAGILNLTLDKPKDNRSVIYEIRWREIGSEWQNATFKTENNTYQDFYTLQLQNQTVYQVQLRRRANALSPICDSQNVTWSDWSTIVDVPLEIRSAPKVSYKLWKHHNHSRDFNLTWDAPPAEESVGGVTYKLKLSVWPCEDPKKIKPITVTQTYHNISITFSEANVSIIAENKVGNSPTRSITIPAVKHLNNCPKHQSKTNAKPNKKCLEWYKLEDGETRLQAAKTSSNKTFQDIEKSVEMFVRHYYFLHIKKKSNFQTIARCPFYSKEGAPNKGPDNVLHFNVTHESAMVSWHFIPVENQRGFLLQYLIWVSGGENTTLYRLPANEKSFFIKNLHPGTSYTVSIAGRTKAGEGPNSTVNFETLSKGAALSWQDQTILSVCVVAVLCTIICSVAARRFRSKLLPVVPSPVIPSTDFIIPHNQDMSQVKEEVHEVVLLQLQELSKPKLSTTPERCTLLQDFGLVVFEEEEDDEEGVTDLRPMKSCFYPNPSYRGQVICLPEPILTSESIYKENDTESTYRNGLFFETVPECDETSL
nr:interleukin-31 receptor subunit alpha [Misgurnus anguillicaudatus]